MEPQNFANAEVHSQQKFINPWEQAMNNSDILVFDLFDIDWRTALLHLCDDTNQRNSKTALLLEKRARRKYLYCRTYRDLTWFVAREVVITFNRCQICDIVIWFEFSKFEIILNCVFLKLLLDEQSQSSNMSWATKESIGKFRSIKKKQTNKVSGLSPRANYTDRATAAWRRS
jgi:hypothetical protein